MVIVPDTSAWVEFLRDTDHPVARALGGLVDARADLAVTECIVMEVLAGARTQRELNNLESLMITYPVLRLEPVRGYEDAAALYRSCRRSGVTIRNLVDLLVAVPVIRHGAELLHNDRDFDEIARHSDLRVYSLS